MSVPFYSPSCDSFGWYLQDCSLQDFIVPLAFQRSVCGQDLSPSALCLQVPESTAALAAVLQFEPLQHATAARAIACLQSAFCPSS
jgi:hypothetical protein